MAKKSVVRLPARYKKCIWCNRELNTSMVDADDSPTDEHVFPESIYGVVVTRDCCKGCNSSLGNAVDVKLLADGRVILAAREAGIKETELLSQYSGTGFDSQNRQARYKVKGGEHRLEPTFHHQGFRIGFIGGKIFPKDLQNAKAKMLRVVEVDKSVQLTSLEIAKCIDDLFARFFEKSGKETVWCPKIKQWLRAVVGPSSIKVDGNYTTYETEWAVAKIVYETAIVLMPADVIAKAFSDLEKLKTFVKRQEIAKSIFRYEPELTRAQKWHEAKIIADGTSFRFAVTLFGKETWMLSFDAVENGSPAKLDVFECTLRNDFANMNKKHVTLILNGKRYNPVVQ